MAAARPRSAAAAVPHRSRAVHVVRLESAVVPARPADAAHPAAVVQARPAVADRPGSVAASIHPRVRPESAAVQARPAAADRQESVAASTRPESPAAAVRPRSAGVAAHPRAAVVPTRPPARQKRRPRAWPPLRSQAVSSSRRSVSSASRSLPRWRRLPRPHHRHRHHHHHHCRRRPSWLRARPDCPLISIRPHRPHCPPRSRPARVAARRRGSTRDTPYSGYSAARPPGRSPRRRPPVCWPGSSR